MDRFGDGARVFARELRLSLAREHLDRQPGEDADLLDASEVFAAFAKNAWTLAEWHAGGQQGPRPSGRLRPYEPRRLRWTTRAWATPLYRTIYDPDGRPGPLRRQHRS
ncbi:MAG: hypothetical protein H7288_14180 [Kineosporiaceae bacterium]|nr:hypothetical protein [Aeromicrobium sp.]